MQRCTHAAVLVGALLVAAPAWAARVAVVADDDLTVYRTVITGFSVEARAEIDEYNLRGDANLEARVVKEIGARKPDVLLAVGPKSANLLRKSFPTTPLIHCMVPNVGVYGLNAPKVAGVALEPPVKDQFQAISTLLPDLKSVGVVHDPKHTALRIKEAQEAAATLGITLVVHEVDAPEKVPAAVAGLAGKVQALWTPADSTVLTVTGLEAMAEFSRTQNVPIYGINANHVQRGALITLALDWPRVGRQAGKLANRVLADPEAIGLLGLQAPEGLDLALNLTVARRLAMAEKVGAASLELAAERGYGVKVFK